MSKDFRSARFWAQELMMAAIFDGAKVIDATMGNGYDTQWLCEQVGAAGQVYAFDVQSDAVERTRKRLEEHEMLSRVMLICDGHEHMTDYVHESVDLIIFNLGWLPGTPHGVTTQTKTTLLAVDAALHLLKNGGLLTVCIYPGHEEGTREKEALLQWASQLDASAYDAMIKMYVNQKNNPPLLLAVRKREQKK